MYKKSANPAPTSTRSYIIKLVNVGHSIYFGPKTDDRVISTFNNLNNGMSLDIDDLEVKPLIIIIQVIAPVLRNF